MVLHALRVYPKARDVLITGRACKLNDDFRIYNFSLQLILPRVPRSCKWEKSPEGAIKANVDASMKAHGTCLGIIAKDSDGFVLSGKAFFTN
ncbi:hypothetical protein Godav_018306 [Gossypium davidsonii]|uniref:RNase H type-1 domain-containing protein n=1 Tax=Gossypium davidsonii TaxID=34287 RepID=A0A7J8QXC6_GOSDV|nr:hypothetical protein [Gossypium davidsonii]